MPEHPPHWEDHETVDDLLRASFASGKDGKDIETGESVPDLVPNTPVRLKEAAKQWYKYNVPDGAFIIVQSDVDNDTPLYVIEDQDGKTYRVKKSDVEVDLERPSGHRAA